jgi:hypothetical protein
MQKLITTTDCGVTYYRGCFWTAMPWSKINHERTDDSTLLSDSKKQDRRETTEDCSKNGG